MGAWSPDNVGNDDAADWALSLAECTDLGLIETTVASVLVPSGEYLEASAACEAIAAVEAVARLLGRWGVRDAYTEPMDAWVERVGLTPSPALVQRAQQALDRILAPQSELRELWEETEQAAEWTAHVTQLRARLQT
jgi:hypothetical protein